MDTPSFEQCVGIDYGSKLAGTTVLAFVSDGVIRWAQTQKKQDADQFILDWFDRTNTHCHIFLDAPLSLPGAYFGRGDDYFYRAADKSVQAMSPMFLGGLTARAMRLQQHLNRNGHKVQEVYPGYLARVLDIKQRGYKKEKEALPELTGILIELLPLPLVEKPQNWHQFDALLALLTGYRFLRKQHLTFGEAKEGCIFV